MQAYIQKNRMHYNLWPTGVSGSQKVLPQHAAHTRTLAYSSHVLYKTQCGSADWWIPLFAALETKLLYSIGFRIICIMYIYLLFWTEIQHTPITDFPFVEGGWEVMMHWMY